MNPFADRITETEHKNRSRQLMHRPGPSSRHKKLAALFLAGLIGLVVSGAVFMDRPAPSDHTGPATEYSESKAHPDPISSLQDGAEIYLTRCMSCHQMNGGGVPGVFPPLTGTDWVTGDEGVLIRIILNGMTGEIEVNGMVYTGAMPPWGSFLNDEEMAALLTYIRTEWGNDGTEITPETVAQVRETVADRAEPWTVEELEAMREANR
ncbi:MAG: cytochrome c [Bacteroidetes bacterium SB0662_bin_6]|nr:cytochrome c [Bacteroidetes bacterium SB0668_bin_1]MYE03464.1 cytochrome c [Bacteroidetes bacterium SB0662_bin_6]